LWDMCSIYLAARNVPRDDTCMLVHKHLSADGTSVMLSLGAKVFSCFSHSQWVFTNATCLYIRSSNAQVLVTVSRSMSHTLMLAQITQQLVYLAT
jgi:hypothetical protein